MQRKKPISAKERRAKLLLKRAIKRGEAAPESFNALSKSRKHPSRRHPNITDPSRKLQSTFIKPDPEFLSTTKQLAATIILQRPIPADRIVYQPSPCDPGTETSNTTSQLITVPKRPKWNYEMSKTTVEKNEEDLFKKWLEDADKARGTWQPAQPNVSTQDNSSVHSDTMPSSPPQFERNLEVWRQLWRVTEISQILLILLDSRCPLLHYPPSLHAYLTTFKPPHKVIFVLTKVDITGPELVNSWQEYLSRSYPGILIVQVECYTERAVGVGQGKRKLYDPHIPSESKRSLVDALKAAHSEILKPPEAVAGNPQKLKDWKPNVIADIDWDTVLKTNGESISTQTLPHTPQDPNTVGPETGSDPHPYLTIGLIGQPNVGKSSLLNALFGVRRVKTSRAPGKTKHFQTLFWTPQIRLVDCPGLVFPVSIDTTSMEMQVLSGILPIARVPSVPACVHYAARLLPLERIFSLQNPTLKENEGKVVEDKRTWRGGRRPERSTQEPGWTTVDIMSAYADAKGYTTAQAGRPDIGRAGNEILRTLAEGRVQWGFYPPETDITTTSLVKAGAYNGQGIWIATETEFNIHDTERDRDYHDSDSDDEESEEGSSENESSDGSGSQLESEEEENDETVNETGRRGGGMFAALASDGGDDDQV